MSLVSTKNSTSTVLSAGTTFTGLVEQVNRYSCLTVITSSDVGGTLHLEFSSDGVNFDQVRTVQISNNDRQTMTIVGKFFRIRYVNGASTQAYFRLQTIFHETKNKLLTNQKKDVATENSEVLFVKEVSNSKLDLITGNVDKQKIVSVTGRNDIGDAVLKILRENNLGLTLATVAEPLIIAAGGNAADDVAGANARSVTITGLSATYVEITETINTAGVSASAATTNSFLRVFSAKVETVGTKFATNLGDINIVGDTSATNYARIPATVGTSSNSLYTIPAGKTGYITQIDLYPSNGTAYNSYVLCKVKSNDATSAPFNSEVQLLIFDRITVKSDYKLQNYIKLEEKTDVYFKSVSSAGNAGHSVNYDILLLDN